MSKTLIEWCDSVWNVVTGCTKVSAGCKNCYAETYAKRFWGERNFTDVRCHVDKLNDPLRWKKPQRIFVNSMSDLFHPNIPIEFIQRVYQVMINCPQHTFIILTKRAERALEIVPKVLTNLFGNTLESNLPNVWLGVSVENQETADERIPILLQIPVYKKILSVEPMLDEINLASFLTNVFMINPDKLFTKEAVEPILGNKSPLDWIIVGGESGKDARSMNPDWVRKIRDDCKAAGVDFYFKQWGEWLHHSLCSAEIGLELFNHNSKYKSLDISNGVYYDTYMKLGKKKAGRLLDGVEHNKFPKGIE